MLEKIEGFFGHRKSVKGEHSMWRLGFKVLGVKVKAGQF